MNNKPDWYRDDCRQIGTDYTSVEEVAIYDERMRRMRDVDAENRNMLEILRLTPDSRVLEIGMGTGAFARAATLVCAQVTAVDISRVMIDYAAGRAREAGLDNISFHNAGFLSYEYPDATYDAVVTGLAMHHLPDMWKLIALRHIFRTLKPGGQFLLLDVVFDFGNETPEEYLERITASEKEVRPNFARHIAEEYSTLGWIMTGLLNQAGFVIESDRRDKEFLRSYHCRKPLIGS